MSDDPEGHDSFGFSVGFGDSPGKEVAIVGAYRHDVNGNDSGAAYLFDTATGRQIAKLLADDGAQSDFFGRSVAISGAIAIVGATGDDQGGDSGSAYLFDISDPANPTQIAKLDPGCCAGGYLNFGDCVAISGTIAIVGANAHFDHRSDSGSAYLFDVSDPANPTQIAQLLTGDPLDFPNDFFGSSVAISGAIAIVGARGDDDYGESAGAAYLFDATSGRHITKLMADDGAAIDFFGWSVAISGAPRNEIAIVGAANDDDNGTDSGSAYLFDVASVVVCTWDLDGDEIVGTGDLILLLGSWGDPYDTADLIELLGNWGPCP